MFSKEQNTENFTCIISKLKTPKTLLKQLRTVAFSKCYSNRSKLFIRCRLFSATDQVCEKMNKNKTVRTRNMSPSPTVWYHFLFSFFFFLQQLRSFAQRHCLHRAFINCLFWPFCVIWQRKIWIIIIQPFYYVVENSHSLSRLLCSHRSNTFLTT